MEKSQSDSCLASFDAYTSSVLGDILKFVVRSETKEEEKSKNNEDSDKESDDYESDDSYDYEREARRHIKARQASNSVEMTSFLDAADHYLAHMKQQDFSREGYEERREWIAEAEGKTLKEIREKACSEKEMMFKSMAMVLRAIQEREEITIQKDMIEWVERMRESIASQPDLGYWKKQFKGEQLELAMNRCWEIYKVETLNKRERVRGLMWKIFQDYAL